ncbi:hypothetical protein GGS24DRAFT_497795 [Hypoxylon argillaceum]|nr:hypothetical protein GGS24DRAFT_497795 [Hypoxylon argillaceum]
MSDVLRDSTGQPIKKGYNYKIRIRHGLELCMYARDWNDNPGAHILAGGPAGCGSIFYIEQDHWLSGTSMQVKAKATTWNTFKTSDLYIVLDYFDSENVSVRLSPYGLQIQDLWGIKGSGNNILLGVDPSHGMRLMPHGSPGAGFYQINIDFAGAFLDVEFVKMPKVQLLS